MYDSFLWSRKRNKPIINTDPYHWIQKQISRDLKIQHKKTNDMSRLSSNLTYAANATSQPISHTQNKNTSFKGLVNWDANSNKNIYQQHHHHQTHHFYKPSSINPVQNYLNTTESSNNGKAKTMVVLAHKPVYSSVSKSTLNTVGGSTSSNTIANTNASANITASGSASANDPNKKHRQTCTGCKTLTDSILYGIYLCHGCIKLYLAEWKKIINKNYEMFILDNIEITIKLIIDTVSETQSCYRKIKLIDFKNYCETSLKCRWCKFRKLLRYITHIPVPRFERDRQNKLCCFYSQKDVIFKEIRLACGLVQPVEVAPVGNTNTMVANTNAPIGQQIDNNINNSTIYKQTQVQVQTQAQTQEMQYQVNPPKQAQKVVAQEPCVDIETIDNEWPTQLYSEPPNKLSKNLDRLNLSPINTDLPNPTIQINFIGPDENDRVKHNMHKIFIDIHLDSLTKHNYLEDLFTPKKFYPVEKSHVIELLPINFITEENNNHTFRTLTDLCNWPTKLTRDLAIDDGNEGNNEGLGRFGSIGSTFRQFEIADPLDPSGIDINSHITNSPGIINIQMENHPRPVKTSTSSSSSWNSFLGSTISGIKNSNANARCKNNNWRYQFLVKDTLITKIMQLLPNCLKYYKLLEMVMEQESLFARKQKDKKKQNPQAGPQPPQAESTASSDSTSTQTKESFTLGAVVAASFMKNAHDFDQTTINSFMAFSLKMRQKMHILQILSNYDPAQNSFFLYSNPIYFNVESLRTYYYPLMGIQPTNTFITSMLKLCRRLIKLPKVLIIFMGLGGRNFFLLKKSKSNFLIKKKN